MWDSVGLWSWNYFTLSLVVHLAQLAQALGGRFGGQVALRHGQHLKADHELAHRGRAQQRRVEMGVQVPLRMTAARRWAPGESPSSRGRRSRTGCRSGRSPGAACLPGRPPRPRSARAASRAWRWATSRISNGQTAQKGTRAVKCSLAATIRSPLLALRRQVIAQQAGPVLLAGSRFWAAQLFGRLDGQVAGRPDLAVRVRVGAAHHRALVLEDLHIVDEIRLAQLLGLLAPGAHHLFHLRLGQLAAGSDHGAAKSRPPGRCPPLARRRTSAGSGQRFARDRLRLLGRQQGREVIVEDKGARCMADCVPRRRAGCPGTGSRSDRRRAGLPAAIFSTCPSQGRRARCGETSTHSRVSGLKRR